MSKVSIIARLKKSFVTEIRPGGQIRDVPIAEIQPAVDPIRLINAAEGHLREDGPYFDHLPEGGGIFLLISPFSLIFLSPKPLSVVNLFNFKFPIF